MKKPYSTVSVWGRTHVIRMVSDRIGENLPNYMNTRQALCGVIEVGDTLEDWLRKHKTVKP